MLVCSTFQKSFCNQIHVSFHWILLCYKETALNLNSNWVLVADLEFGRVQARNMLQHLWTGPISNAAVDVVQGLKSVEVRPIGVSKVRSLPEFSCLSFVDAIWISLYLHL